MTDTIEIPILTAIKSKPHWRVTIKPDTFNAEAIPSLLKCWEVIDTCKLSLRGWDYPHIDRDNRGSGVDFIHSWCGYFPDQDEYWRFYQSGQFIHLFTFREDTPEPEVQTQIREKAIRRRTGTPAGFVPTTFMEIFQTLYRVTEIFEFAARYANRYPIGNSLSITITLNGILNRMLFIWDFNRELFDWYYAGVETLSHTWTLSVSDLEAASSEKALDATLWFFERFQWHRAAREPLAEMQQKMLTGKLSV